MPKSRDWIVFTDIDGKWDAVENNHREDDDQVQTIYDMGGKVMAFVYLPTKNEARNYAEEICTR